MIAGTGAYDDRAAELPAPTPSPTVPGETNFAPVDVWWWQHSSTIRALQSFTAVHGTQQGSRVGVEGMLSI